MQGRIVKGIAGFYYVYCRKAEGIFKIYECKAKGVFRRDQRKPLVGDDVELTVLDEDKAQGNIIELLPRHSELIRPAVANIDQALIIFSVVRPKPNFNLLDRLLIMMRQQDVPCIICFNKTDIDEDGQGEAYRRIYENCGCRILQTSTKSGAGLEELRTALAGKTTAVAGPSGVGKSSIVNSLQSRKVMETGQISAKIERGKHTTRHTELIAMGEDTYILDTPGFSSLDLFDLEKEQLAAYYPEFAPYEKNCRFGGCSHVAEQVCGVRDAVEQGAIHQIRYGNYCLLYEELKSRRKY